MDCNEKNIKKVCEYGVISVFSATSEYTRKQTSLFWNNQQDQRYGRYQGSIGHISGIESAFLEMKLLITGIHGFVGSNLVKALSKDHEIYGLDIIAPEKEDVVKTYSWDDLENPSTGSGTAGLPEVDAIIHLAGKAHDT